MLIKNAGYMWHRKHIDWTNRSTFVGLSDKDDDEKVVFADQTAIYGLYSANHECVYIGQAGRGEKAGLYDRLRTHVLDDHLFCLWERFTWFGFYSPKQLHEEDYNDPIAKSLGIVEALDNLESMAIYLAMPRFNRQLEHGFKHVAWYYQEAEYEESKNAIHYART